MEFVWVGYFKIWFEIFEVVYKICFVEMFV